MVSPGDDLSSLTSNVIETYFSEEYPDFLYTSFEERSSKMMNDFVDRLALVCEKDRQKRKTVYFHNFARFDGILLLKHFLNLGNKYTIKPLIVNKHLYEISVYKGKKHLFNLRDSYTLLPSSLRSLASNLCPNHLKLRKCASGPETDALPYPARNLVSPTPLLVVPLPIAGNPRSGRP